MLQFNTPRFAGAGSLVPEELVMEKCLAMVELLHIIGFYFIVSMFVAPCSAFEESVGPRNFRRMQYHAVRRPHTDLHAITFHPITFEPIDFRSDCLASKSAAHAIGYHHQPFPAPLPTSLYVE